MSRVDPGSGSSGSSSVANAKASKGKRSNTQVEATRDASEQPAKKPAIEDKGAASDGRNVQKIMTSEKAQSPMPTAPRAPTPSPAPVAPHRAQRQAGAPRMDEIPFDEWDF
eukprot:8793502-Pyramimonas_sp.AAC.1